MDHDTKRFRLPRLRSEDDQGRDPNKNYEELDQLFDQAVKKSRHKRITTYASKKQHSTGPAYTSVRKTPRKVEQMKTSEVDTELVNIGLHQKDVGEWRQTQFEYKQNLITKQPDREGEESNTDFLPNLKSLGSTAPSDSAQNSDERVSEISETAAAVETNDSNRNRNDLLQALLRFEKIAQNQREQEAARSEVKEDSTEAFKEAYEEMIEESDATNEPIERESAGFIPEEVTAQGETEGTKEEQSDLKAEAFDITPPAHDLDDTENFGLIEQPERHEIEGFEEQEEALVNRFFQEMEIPEPISREDQSKATREPESYDLGLISEKPLSANFDQGLYYNENSRPDDETQTRENSEAIEADMDELDWEAPSAEFLDENAFYAPFNLDSSDSWLTPDRDKKEEERAETPEQPAERTKSTAVLTPEQEAAREKRREELKQKFIAQKKQAAMSEAAERGRLAYATEKKEMSGQTAAMPHRSELALFKEALEDESIRKAFYIALLGLVLFAAFVLVFRPGFNTASWVMAGTLLVVLILTSDTNQRSTLIMLALTLVLFLFIEFYQIFAQGYALHIFDYLWFILTPICTMTSFAFFHDYREWKLEHTTPIRPTQENPEEEESEGNESDQKSEDRKADEPESDQVIQALAREESKQKPNETPTETLFEGLSDTPEPESDSLFIREEAMDEDEEDSRSETQEILLHLMNLEGRKSRDEAKSEVIETNGSEEAAASEVFDITPLEPIEAEPEDLTDTASEDDNPDVPEAEVPEEEASDQETESSSEAADEEAEKESDPSEDPDTASAGEPAEETKEESEESETHDEEDEHHDHPIDHFESLTQPIQIISMDTDDTASEAEASDSKTKSAGDHNAWIATELSDLHVNVNEDHPFHNESLTEQEAKQFEQDFSFFFDSDDDE